MQKGFLKKPSHNNSSLQRPQVLKPVQPPTKRDGSHLSGSDHNLTTDLGYMSQGNNQIFNQGYLSQGGQGPSDNESARLSNVNTYKYNQIVPNGLSGSKQGNMMANIRKVSPN